MDPGGQRGHGGLQSVIRVLVASPVRFYADGLAQHLSRERGLDVVAVVRDIADLRASAARCNADVILLDAAFVQVGGPMPVLDALRPSSRIVALAVGEDDDDILDWAEHGVDGLVTRDCALADVVDAVRGAERGELHCSPKIAATLLRRVESLAAGRSKPEPQGPVEELTARELEILGLIDTGLSNKEIARRLSIEVTTVKNHVHHLLEKLGVHHRREAAEALRRSRVATSARRVI